MIWKRLKNLWALSALSLETIARKGSLMKDEDWNMIFSGKTSNKAEIIDLKDPIQAALEDFDK